MTEWEETVYDLLVEAEYDTKREDTERMHQVRQLVHKAIFILEDGNE